MTQNESGQEPACTIGQVSARRAGAWHLARLDGAACYDAQDVRLPGHSSSEPYLKLPCTSATPPLLSYPEFLYCFCHGSAMKCDAALV